jgi:hypothetical protein
MTMATNPSRTDEASRQRVDLGGRRPGKSRQERRQAWDALVERYTPLIWSMCRRYQLGVADAEDAAQSIWLKLADQLGSLRDPAALPGWLATTTANAPLEICEAGPGLSTRRGGRGFRDVSRCLWAVGCLRGLR